MAEQGYNSCSLEAYNPAGVSQVSPPEECSAVDCHTSAVLACLLTVAPVLSGWGEIQVLVTPAKTDIL